MANFVPTPSPEEQGYGIWNETTDSVFYRVVTRDLTSGVGTGNPIVYASGVNDIPCGITLENDIAHDYPINYLSAHGKHAFVEASGAVTVGDILGATTDGRVITVTPIAGQYSVGEALDTTTNGGIIRLIYSPQVN